MDVRPLELWNQWAIQILVLQSFTLQVILVFLAGIRRHEASAMPKLILWLAYQLADSTAIYAIGHLSLCTLPPEHQLVPFWAPFLLLHLGGPDSITAYALQDSQLWLRHLQNLVVQVLGAAYVLYKHILVASDTHACLRLASILMFAVGLVKYAERTWALKCGNLNSIRSSLEKKARAPVQHHGHYHLDRNEETTHRAHMLFHVCMRAMVSYPVETTGDSENRSLQELKNLADQDYKRFWKVMEIELSLMYDILYTKASVIYTWCGYCIRLVSPLVIVTAASFLLLQVSAGRDGYNRVDVAVTCTLLAGAFILETWSLVNAVASTWTYSFFCTMRWSWPRRTILYPGRGWHRLRRLLGKSNRTARFWSGKMGQYNMLHFCSRHNGAYQPLLGRLAETLGCKERWIKFHYSGTVNISDELKLILLRYVQELARTRKANVMGVIRKDWGKQAMQLNEEGGMYRHFKDKNYLGAEFQEGIIIWHIGTDVLLAKLRADDAGRDVDETHLVQSIRALSNYMMFLLVERPYMLPGLAQSMLYRQTCDNLTEQWNKDSDCQDRNFCRKLKELFCLRDGPHVAGLHRDMHMLAKILYKTRPKDSTTKPRLPHAHNVAKELHEKAKEKGRKFLLKLLLDVWTDFLVYAANRCSRDSHAMKLSSGGELTTVVWLMIDYLRRASYKDGEV